MQWTMTGTVSRIAIRPDQRCTTGIQAGAAPRIIREPVTSWTTANTAAAVVSQALAYSGEEKPATSSAYLVGWCSPAYSPSTRATAQPLSRATTSGLAYWSRARGTAVCSLVIAHVPFARRVVFPPRVRRGRSWADDGVLAGDGRGLKAAAVEGEATVAEVERRRGVPGLTGHGHSELGPVREHRPADPGGQPVDGDPRLVDA